MSIVSILAGFFRDCKTNSHTPPIDSLPSYFILHIDFSTKSSTVLHKTYFDAHYYWTLICVSVSSRADDYNDENVAEPNTGKYVEMPFIRAKQTTDQFKFLPY